MAITYKGASLRFKEITQNMLTDIKISIKKN